MSTIHLTTGSVEPPRVDGLLRLYSMAFCPFAQRTRVVLRAKEIPHDIVNINLAQKPEWYFKIHPEGKVPALLDGDKIVTESLDISDYLDEKYPNNPLYPTDPEAKKQDKELIQKIAPITSTISKILFSKEEQTPEEWAKELLPPLKVFDNELARRGTTFFGGDNPGMVDYMFWPWSERGGAITVKFGKRLPIDISEVAHMHKWRENMLENPVVADTITPQEQFYKHIQGRVKGETMIYDNL